MKQKKFMLPESEIPTHFFNIQAVMPNKPMPFLNPATKEPLKAEDLYPIFCKACAQPDGRVDPYPRGSARAVLRLSMYSSCTRL